MPDGEHQTKQQGRCRSRPHRVNMAQRGAEELVHGGGGRGVRVRQVQERQGAGALQHRALRRADRCFCMGVLRDS